MLMLMLTVRVHYAHTIQTAALRLVTDDRPSVRPSADKCSLNSTDARRRLPD